MNTRATQLLTIALLVAAAVVVSINTWLALRSLTVFNQSQGWVAHTWQVLNQIERITGSLKDAENGDRGYLISGDEAYLAPYVQAHRDLPEELDSLRQLTADNPSQQPRIAEMRAVIEARLRLLEEGIEERREGKTNSVRALVVSGTGKLEMDHLRSLAAGMQEEERRLLAERTHISQVNEIRARVTILFAGTIDLLLVVLIFWYLARERKLRAIADSTADRLGKLQFVSDVALTQLGSSELTLELLERVRKVVGSDAALLATFNDDALTVESSSGFSVEKGTRIQFGSRDPVRHAIESGHVISVPEVATSEFPASDFRHNLRTMVVMPLALSGRVRGVLIAGRHHDHFARDSTPNGSEPFDTQYEQLLSVVADRISISIDRHNAYEAEREARRSAEVNAEQVKLLNADLEARVRQRTADLEAANRELEAFSFSVSHDLRAPLRTVDGFSLALEEDYRNELDADGRDFIRRIREGVQRMGQLIDALLQLSRITRADLNTEYFDISTLASEIARQVDGRESGP